MLSPEGTDPDDEPGKSVHWEYVEPSECEYAVVLDICNPTPTPTPTPTYGADEWEQCPYPLDIPHIDDHPHINNNNNE